MLVSLFGPGHFSNRGEINLSTFQEEPLHLVVFGSNLANPEDGVPASVHNPGVFRPLYATSEYFSDLSNPHLTNERKDPNRSARSR